MTTVGAFPNIMLLVPRYKIDVDSTTPMTVLTITNLDAWRAAKVIWAAPSSSVIASSTSSTATGSSSSAGPATVLPLSIHAKYVGHWPVLEAMAHRAFRSVGKACMLQLLSSYKVEVQDAKDLYQIVETCVKTFAGTLTDELLLEIMAQRHFEPVADSNFMNDHFYQLSVDDKDLEEFEKINESQKQVHDYRSAHAAAISRYVVKKSMGTPSKAKAKKGAAAAATPSVLKAMPYPASVAWEDISACMPPP
eukprot:879093-Lingulodinium_polyedra.AAC.1